MKLLTSICVMAGGRGNDATTEEAYQVGKLLALNGVWTIYGGGRKGSMGAVADGVLDHHGDIIGYMPGILKDKEIAHPMVDITFVPTLAERKEKMFQQSDAFLCIPGAIGTMDELFDAWCRIKLGYNSKRLAILNTNGYWDSLFTMFQDVVGAGFAPADRMGFVEEIRSLPQLDAWIRSVKDGVTGKNGRDPEVEIVR